MRKLLCDKKYFRILWAVVTASVFANLAGYFEWNNSDL